MNWTVESIKALLQSRDDAVLRGLVRIYEYQKYDEQRNQETKYHNRMGFTKSDAKFGTSIVENWIVKKRPLSPNQMYRAREMMNRHARQILRIMNGEQGLPIGNTIERTK
jgi:hypothetical protein